MAKVKITGHASGTGVITVTAPNTSTDRTITLPDATGTLLNSDGSGANLTSLPSGSQLVHSGTTQVETTATGAKIGSTSSAQTHLDITTNTSSYGGVYFTDGVDEAYRGAVQYKHGDDFMHMYTASTERMRIHSNGVTSIPAGVALGVGTANTASNVLDDYEEGTWTPTCSTATIASINQATYTKIGRLVHVFAYVVLSADGTSGAASLSGLPFSIPSNNYEPSVVQISTNSDGRPIVGRAEATTSEITLFWADQSQTGVPTSSIDNGHWMISQTYHVA